MGSEMEMEVSPSFIENECKIVFSFRFILDKQKVGDVTIFTCMEKLKKKKRESFHTIAYCSEFSILEEYRHIMMAKLMNFLNIIGIQRFLFYEK